VGHAEASEREWGGATRQVSGLGESGALVADAESERLGEARRLQRDDKRNGLAGEAKAWGTPTARDHKDSGDCSNVPDNGLLGRMVKSWSGMTDQPGSLSPEFHLWLMGWPAGWNALEPLEMDKYRSWLQQHGASSTPETWWSAIRDRFIIVRLAIGPVKCERSAETISKLVRANRTSENCWRDSHSSKVAIYMAATGRTWKDVK
jgi:hypothetical protein